ncbi:MAG: alpha/beta hydrolase [Bdellovibrionales bacterium]|nr:alpha/beta hydrolase [Bdellovibrionales bacterium]
MALHEINGISLNIETIKSKSSLNTFFVHGNLASNHWWHPMIEYSPNGSGSLFLFEWRGCGNSAPPQQVSELEISQLGDDLAKAVFNLSPESKVHLVGHSTGGPICLQAALLCPEKIERIVLLDSVGAKGIQFNDAALAGFELMSKDRTICEQVMATTIEGVQQDNALFQQLVDDAFSVAPLIWSGIPRALSHLDLEHQIKQIKAPTLILHGEKDVVLPIEDAQKLAALLPQSQLSILPEHGHSLNIEDPKLFAQLCFDFLKLK